MQVFAETGCAEFAHEHVSQAARRPMSTPLEAPLLSVITPSLNSGRFLGEAIESVQAQGFRNVEHILADGGSTDGTLQMLERYPHLVILRGPDSGLYEALNRALAAARGGIIGILNADDCYQPGAFADVLPAFGDGRVMAAGGDAVAFRDPKQAPLPEDRLNSIAGDPLFGATLGNPAMNAWFFRAAVFKRIGSFDARFKVAGDREFMLRFACSGLSCVKIERLIYRYRIHPDSMTFAGNAAIWDTVAREHSRITADYLRKPGLSGRAYSLIRQANTRDTLRLAIRSAGRQDWRQFWLQSLKGVRHDPLWPLRLAKRAVLWPVAKRRGTSTAR
jgi:glycosyltransferase involved in cell wall biosynthesis